VRYADQEHFLAMLDPDPIRADQKCKALWQKMVFYFRKHGASSPEDLAQEVFARATSRIAEGQVVYAVQPDSYFFGVARNVLREDWKHAKAQPVPLSEEAEECLGSNKEMERMERTVLLETCLRQLNADERAFLKMYIHEGPVRTGLAAGISANAASIRFHRLTVKLQTLTQQFRQAR
jgi:DNA-directed RNA polymerase specialized sigma24 family protein